MPSAPAKTAPSSRRIVAWTTGIGLVLTIYLLRLDHVCGLYSDDAWYVLLAKALATGNGYTLINGPTPGVLPYFPPGFPWLLSFVFRVAPAFPGNVWLLKLISIVAMLAAGVLTVHFATREMGLGGPLAAAIGLATALHPGQVFLATSTVMSECVFTLVQLAAVLLLELAVRRRGAEWLTLGAGLLAGFAYLVRSIGATVVLAGIFYLLKERRWRTLAVFALAAGVGGGPWTLYARTHIPTPEQQAEMNDAIAIPYTEHFWLRVSQDPSLGEISASEIPARMWDGAQTLATRAAGALAFYPLYHTLEPEGWAGSAQGATPVSILTGLLIALGFVAALRRRVGVSEILMPLTGLAVTLWQASPFRLVLPLLPFALCYIALGVRTIARFAGGRDGGRTALAAMVVLLAVNLASHVAYLQDLHGPSEERPAFIQLFDEARSVVGWTRDNVPADQIVAAIHPALAYLYGGHRTIGYNEPRGSWQQWRRLGVHYLVETSYFGHLSTLPEGRFDTVYRSPRLGMRVLDLHRIYEPH